MNVVGHDHPGIQIHIWVLAGQPAPGLIGDDPKFVQTHFTVDYLTKQQGAILGNHGDKISPGLGVIIARQADGSAVVPAVEQYNL